MSVNVEVTLCSYRRCPFIAGCRKQTRWIGRLDQLAPATVVSSRPVVEGGTRRNVGFFWESGTGTVDIHGKLYLPDEPGFWEASWYQRGDGDFSIAHTAKASIGFLICTELWFSQHAREYGRRGAHIIVCPRATPTSTAPKWLAGGQAAAVISGAFCLSSNLAGTTTDGGDFAGVGWIVEPEEGEILGVNSASSSEIEVIPNLQGCQMAVQRFHCQVLAAEFSFYIPLGFFAIAFH